MKIQKTICIVLVLSLTVAGGYACKKNEQANPADSVVVSFLSGKAEAKSTGGWEMIKVNDSLPLSA
ncbi:MAG: hypothetical protein K8R21_14370 [Leptospira sp.]|nr:hypothetical protein [Leptospira sp.]